MWLCDADLHTDPLTAPDLIDLDEDEVEVVMEPNYPPMTQAEYDAMDASIEATMDYDPPQEPYYPDSAEPLEDMGRLDSREEW